MAVKAPWTYNQPDIIQDPWWALGSVPYAGFGEWPTNYPTATAPGETTYGQTPREPQGVGQSAYDYWRPYLQGLGIMPLSGGWLTATSPAMRERMNPLALAAMQSYFTSGPKSWADYLGWTGGFMPQTPQIQQRRWMPFRWR